jgi:hypothetical protein
VPWRFARGARRPDHSELIGLTAAAAIATTILLVRFVISIPSLLLVQFDYAAHCTRTG